MAAEGGAFRLITVHEEDEDELVVHAGSGKASAAKAATDEPSAVPQAAVSHASDADQGQESTAVSPEAAARQESLRRRARELAEAEEGLEDPHAFARTRIYVLVALALLVVAIVVYTIVVRA